ncbi:MAG: heavy metal-binding domain-containing protein [Burkholderiales bacterium]
MNSNPSYQAQARAHPHTRFDAPGAARLARTTLYTCPMHSEIVRDAPSECPHCGATLIPMRQAIVRAARALRSLTEVTRALRLYPV